MIKDGFVKIVNLILTNRSIRLIKKVRRQDHYFSTRLNYANKKIREIGMNLVNTTYNSTEYMINKLQSLKCETKLKFYKNIINYYDNMNIRMDEDPFAKNAQCISKLYHEELLVIKFLQTEPHIKNMNINYYDLYYTIIKNRDEKEILDNQYENDYFNVNDFIPNHYIGRKIDNEILR